MWHGDVILTVYNDIIDLHAANVGLFVYYLSQGLARVCEIELFHMGKNVKIELFHMGKNNGNPDLVC